MSVLWNWMLYFFKYITKYSKNKHFEISEIGVYDFELFSDVSEYMKNALVFGEHTHMISIYK